MRSIGPERNDHMTSYNNKPVYMTFSEPMSSALLLVALRSISGGEEKEKGRERGGEMEGRSKGIGKAAESGDTPGNKKPGTAGRNNTSHY